MRRFRDSARLGAALALPAVLGLVLAAPVLAAQQWYVNHDAKQCIPYAGIGLGGNWVVAETCPEGYSQPVLPQEPWYIRLLNALDRWFGLREKVVWVPSAAQIALVTSAVLVLRRLLQLLSLPFIDRLTNGVGTLLISVLLSFLVAVQPSLADGKLTAYEAVLALVTTVAGAAGLWEALKRLVRHGA
jgi:hypothetical protein